MNIAKLVKMVIFAGLLIGAGYFLGSTCELIYQQHALILAPSRELLYLFLRFLLAAGAVALTSGLVAVLVRPLWAGFIVFLLSGLAMLLAWELRPETGILAAVYVLASLLYAWGVASEMDNRIRFSLRPISESQPILLLALAVLASASLYLGYKAQIEREGFSIPSSFKESMLSMIERATEGQLEPRLEGLLEPLLEAQLQELPPELKEKAKETFLSQFSTQKDAFLNQFREQSGEQFTEALDETVKPYERFIPIVLAIFLFQPLLIITRLLGPLPVWILRALFPLLGLLRITKVVTETREMERLSLD